MNPLSKLKFIALIAATTSGCADAKEGETSPKQSAPVATQMPAQPIFDEGALVPRAIKKILPAVVRETLPCGARSMFCLKTKLGEKNVLVHGWNPVKGDGRIDILVPVKTKATYKSRSRLVYTRLNGVTVGRIASDNYSIRLTPLKAKKSGWVMSVNWSESQVAGAFSTVPMIVFIAPDGDGSKVLKQNTRTESSAGGNEFYDLRVDKSGDAFLMLVSEGFDAGIKNLQPYRWEGSKFVLAGDGATRPLIPKAG